MGRPRLSEEARNEASKRLITAAKKLIEREGLAGVTIRGVAAEAGSYMAEQYMYFKDLDELLLFACVDVLQDYARELSEVQHKVVGPEENYLAVWEVFCHHAFRQPACMNHLFFSPHSHRLDEVIAAYYKLYPELLADKDEALRAMMRGSDLPFRNMQILRPLALPSTSQERLALVNTATVAYFRSLLEYKIRNPQDICDEMRTRKMLEACKLFLRLL